MLPNCKRSVFSLHTRAKVAVINRISTVYLPCIYRICTVFNSAKDTKKAALFWAAFWNICVCKTGLHTINDYSTI